MSTLQNQQAPYMIDVREVAKILAVSKRTVWRLESRGDIPPAVRIGRITRWRLADVEAWIDARANGHSNGNPRRPR